MKLADYFVGIETAASVNQQVPNGSPRRIGASCEGDTKRGMQDHLFQCPLRVRVERPAFPFFPCWREPGVGDQAGTVVESASNHECH